MQKDDARRLIDEVDTRIERFGTLLKDAKAIKARIQRLENALMLIHDHPAAHREIVEIAANVLDDN